MLLSWGSSVYKWPVWILWKGTGIRGHQLFLMPSVLRLDHLGDNWQDSGLAEAHMLTCFCPSLTHIIPIQRGSG